MAKTGFILTRRYLEHDTGPHHPECIGRISAICARLMNANILSETELIDPRPVDLLHVQRVHAHDYIEEFRFSCETGAEYVDSIECPICPVSFEVARLATGGVIDACDAVMAGRLKNAFCTVRPPGHHAERAHAMGFCFFNNVAVAAEYLRDHHGLSRIAILDWDVHHGNGTQHHFERDPEVLYISIHQNPRTIFPGTGFEHEVGVGEGMGATLNVPVMPASEDEVYHRAFEEKILPAINAFKPEFILISAGFDAHKRDHLAHVSISTECFAWMTERVCDLADAHCQGRLVSVLEGGYDFVSLADSVLAHIEVLIKRGQ